MATAGQSGSRRQGSGIPVFGAKKRTARETQLDINKLTDRLRQVGHAGENRIDKLGFRPNGKADLDAMDSQVRAMKEELEGLYGNVKETIGLVDEATGVVEQGVAAKITESDEAWKEMIRLIRKACNDATSNAVGDSQDLTLEGHARRRLIGLFMPGEEMSQQSYTQSGSSPEAYLSLQRQMKVVEKQLESAHRNLATAAKDADRLRKDLAAANEKIQRLETSCERQRGENERKDQVMQDEKERESNKRAALELRIAELEQEKAGIMDQQQAADEKLSNENEDLRQAISNLESKNEGLEKEVDEYKEKSRVLENEVQEIETELVHQKTLKESFETASIDHQKQNGELQNNLNALNQEVNKVQDERDRAVLGLKVAPTVVAGLLAKLAMEDDTQASWVLELAGHLFNDADQLEIASTKYTLPRPMHIVEGPGSVTEFSDISMYAAMLRVMAQVHQNRFTMDTMRSISALSQKAYSYEGGVISWYAVAMCDALVRALEIASLPGQLAAYQALRIFWAKWRFPEVKRQDQSRRVRDFASIDTVFLDAVLLEQEMDHLRSLELDGVTIVKPPPECDGFLAIENEPRIIRWLNNQQISVDDEQMTLPTARGYRTVPLDMDQVFWCVEYLWGNRY